MDHSLEPRKEIIRWREQEKEMLESEPMLKSVPSTVHRLLRYSSPNANEQRRRC